MSESKIKKILSSRALLFVLLLLTIWVSLILVKTFYKSYQLEQEIANLKKEIGKIESGNQGLTQLLDSFSNPDFLEKEAREKLNLKKEGEQVVMIPEAVNQGSTTNEIASGLVIENANSVPERMENNLVKWWRYFFGR